MATVIVGLVPDEEAVEAAELMAEHGVVDIDVCAAGWSGEYPSAPGRIYHDPRPQRYGRPERRVRQERYEGVNRRAI